MPDDSEITETIIGAAYTVLNKLKPGLDEKLYERALIIQLGKQGLACEDQKEFDVYYDEHRIGSLIPDLIVNESIVVDPKVVSAFNETPSPRCLDISILPASKPRCSSISNTPNLGSNACRYKKN